MENSHDEYTRIKDFLRQDPRGMNIRQISEGLKINRNSVAKYLDILASQEEVEVRVSGKSKIFNLSQRIPLSGLLQYSSNWIIILNSELRIVQINDAFLAYSRLLPEKILHRIITDIPTLPCTHPVTISLARKALAGKECQDELTLETATGRSHITLTATPTVFQDNSTGIILVFEDITEKKKYETALRSSEEKFRNLVETSGDWIWEVDRCGKFTYSSPQVRDILGYEPEEIIGRSPFDLMPPEEAGRVSRIILAAARRQQPISSLENLNIHRNGHAVHLETSGKPFLDKSGTLAGYRGIDRDITERKRTENLQGEFRFLQQLIDVIPNPVYYKDTKGIYQGCNRAFESFVGKSKSEITGKTAYDLFFRELADVYTQKDSEIFRYPGTQVYEYLLNHSDGTTRNVIFYKAAITYPEEKTAGLVGIVVDITGRKQAEEALRESEERYRTMFENTGTAMVILEPDTTISLANSQFERLSGYSRSEIEGKLSWTIFVAADDLAWMKEQHRIRRENGRMAPTQYEFWFTSRHGQVRKIFINIDIIPGTKKSIASLMDITDRIAAEIQLKRSEERYRLLLQNVNDGVIVHDVSLEGPGEIREVNDRICQLLGYSRDELLNMSVYDLDVPEQRERAPAISCRLFTEKQALFETEFLTKNGQRVCVEISARLFELEKKPHVLAIVRDISERKKADMELLESRIQLANAMDLARIVNWEMDVGSGIFTFTDPFYSLFGTRAEQEGGYRMSAETFIREFVHPDDRTFVLDRIAQARTGIVPEFEQMEHRILRRDGTVRDIIVRHQYIRDASGNVVRLCGVSQDITERKQAEEALRQANWKLNLLTGITRHDIKNQLLALSMYIFLCEESLEDQGKTGEYLEKQKEIVNTISRQISFTKEYEELGVKAPSWQNVSEIVARAGGQVRMEGITVEPGNPLLEIYANLLLEKVFFNLIENAVRHGGNGMTAIRIRTQKKNGSMLIAVEDNGKGIPATSKQLIFSKNFGANTGMGLYFSREILSITGITIEETGLEGHGACFELSVPDGMYRFADS